MSKVCLWFVHDVWLSLIISLPVCELLSLIVSLEFNTGGGLI